MLFQLVLLVLALIIIAILYIKIRPVFGGSLSKDDKAAFHHFENYDNKKEQFINQQSTDMDMSISTIISFIKDSFTGKKDRKPSSKIKTLDCRQSTVKNNSLIWFGHSTFLLTLENKKLLIDPMFGSTPSPVSFIGGKRYSEDLLPIIDELPSIDAVFLSHDHYDHLDYPSIIKLKDKVDHFFVPHGVASHLEKWGIGKDKISELNWWDEMNWQGLTIGSVPSQHFSGRGLFNRNSTLWTGWVILSKEFRLYSSGDGGYGPHFKQIGEKYGPFDLTLIEGGQYDSRWSAVHMVPEESVQAHMDAQGNNMMLTHWGAFTLAYHGWTEPVERALVKAKEKQVNLLTPKIGETVPLDKIQAYSNSAWWKE